MKTKSCIVAFILTARDYGFSASNGEHYFVITL